MNQDSTVIIPKDKKVVFQKKNKTVYVLYETERVYSAEKKITYPKRVMIGKRCADNSELMIPNERFYVLFPNQAMPEEHQSVERSACLKVGTYVVIKQIFQDYGLDKMLNRRFGDQAGLFSDLVSYLIVKENNAGQYYPDYAYDHPLFTPGMRVLSDSSVSQFFTNINEGQILGFLDDWNNLQSKKDRIYISYDSTNKNSQAGDIDIVEFGKPKDDKSCPIFNLSIAYNVTNEKPLFYEQYPGSINDVSQFKFVVDKALDYNYRNIGFILDRGYFSKSNIEYMDQNKYAFIMLVKGCKPLVSRIIDENRGSFETKRHCAIHRHQLNATTVQQALFQGDEKKRFVHLYFSAEKMRDDRKYLNDKIDQMSALHEKCIGKEVCFSQEHRRYFDFHFDDQNKFLFAQEKAEIIEKELDYCGYFCIVSSEKMTAEQAYVLYKGRDISEKLFRADKSFLGCKSMRVHTPQALSTKTLVEFVALIVRNRIYTLLKEEMLKLSSKRNFMTVPAAIRELEKIEMVRRNNGLYRLDHAVTHTQQIILRSFGIDVDVIRKEAGLIAATLFDKEQDHE